MDRAIISLIILLSYFDYYSIYKQQSKFALTISNQKAPQGGCGHRRQHARLRCRKFKSPVILTLTLDRIKDTSTYTVRVCRHQAPQSSRNFYSADTARDDNEKETLRRRVNQHDIEMKTLKGRVEHLTKKDTSSFTPYGTQTTSGTASPELQSSTQELERLREQLAKAHAQPACPTM